MNLMFVDRKEELTFLQERYKKKGFEFFVIYGRRRIGKTELIKQFITKNPHLYFLCDKSGTERNMHRFKRKIAEYLNEPPIETNHLEDLFAYLAKKTQNTRLILVFDEFSYLVEKDTTVPSQFQLIVDEILKKTNIFLILCGSSISRMEKGVLSAKSALYGRKTAHIKVDSLPFTSFQEFYPTNTLEKNIEFYATLGAVPFYLEKFTDKKTTFDNIREQLFNKKGKLYEEIDFLLKEELREPDTYKTILSALAAGHNKVVEIANTAGIKVHDIDKYLKTLLRLGIIQKEIPIDTVKSKKTTYTIKDNFFSFSFLFSEPQKSNLEIGETLSAEETLQKKFPSYVGRRFESLIRDELLKKLQVFTAQKTGKWWGHYRDRKTNTRKEVEIDIVALNTSSQQILFGECKWKNNVDGTSILRDLKGKTQYFEWLRTHQNWEKHYLVVAKSFQKKTPERNVSYIDLAEIQKKIQ
ncbi:MAG: ATP-binding protein [Candidatus Thermoplasmatota archaeon]